MAEAHQTALSCGEMLKSAREQRGWSVEEVASKLHLSSSKIEAIERNEITEVAETLAFVRGYVRAYSNLVNLPLDEVMSAFGQLEWQGRDGTDVNVLAKSQLTFTQNSSQKPVASMFKKAKSASKWWIIIVLVVLLGIALFSWRHHHVKPAATSTVSSDASTTISNIHPVRHEVS